MRSVVPLLVAVLAVAGFAESILRADLITFEQTPSGSTPVDDAPLSTPYNLTGGGTLRFFFDANGNNEFDSGTDVDTLFEAVGASSHDGFDGSGGADTADAGFTAQLGSWEIRPPAGPGNSRPAPPPLIADFTTAQIVTDFSGEIWDIDGTSGATEQWRVDILSGANAVLATLTSPVGNNNALDGRPWVFSFSALPSGADKARITFIGTDSAVGTGFNNFGATLVPEPSTLALAILAALGACFLARRRSG
jgi:hypothetical protein